MFKSFALFAVLATTNVALACGPEAGCGACAGAEKTMGDVSEAEGTKVALSVPGLTCKGSSAQVMAVLRQVDGVNAVATDFGKHEAQVAIDASKTNVKALIEALSNAKFEASELADKQG